MYNILKAVCVIVLLMATSMSFALDQQYKKIDDFKTLESFKSVDEFESSYNKYIQQCLDTNGGGTGGIPCLIGYKMWDRELNIYYNKLMKILGSKEKNLLKESQLAWIQERDKTIDFNSHLLDLKYKNEIGTVYVVERADDADRLMTPVVKQRAIILKNWFEFVKQ